MLLNPTTVLNQLLALLPEQQFQTFVGQHEADKYTKTYSCWNQLTTMLYAQATGKESLRHIESGLGILDSIWADLGLRSIKRSTIAYANVHRPAAIYESLFYELLNRCEGTLPRKYFSFRNPLKAIDATTIDLCLALFPWARFRETKGAIRLHVTLDVRMQIPEACILTDGKEHEVSVLQDTDLTQFAKGTIFVMDRGYNDYRLLRKIKRAGHHFVVRRKKNAQIVRIGRHKEAKTTGVIQDERIAFALPQAQEDYPDDLRLVTYIDPETCQIYEFMTDMFHLSAANVAAIYRARWEIETFFRWIKQNLKIKTFFGTSRNAVLTQIWIAMIYFLLLKWLSAIIGAAKILELTRKIAEVCLIRMPLLLVLACSPKKLEAIRVRDGPQMSFF